MTTAPTHSRPDYEKAKKLLRAKLAEMMPGAVIDEATLIWALNDVLDDAVRATDNPSGVSPGGYLLMGPTDADWAETALLAILSPL